MKKNRKTETTFRRFQTFGRLAIALVIFLLGGTAHSQSFTVFDIDTSDFPIMRAKFWAFDSQNKQINNLAPTDFEVTENGEFRNVISVSCPTPKPPENVSVAMSIDISGSMLLGLNGEIPVDLAKKSAKELCNNVEVPPSEFALQTCNHKAMIIQDFTKNRLKIISAIDPINAGGRNDFVEHLLNRLTGLLNFAKTGKYKPVAVLFTDAGWHQLSLPELQMCKDTCLKYGIEFYAVIYSYSGTQPDGIKKSLQNLADYTGGHLYDGVTTTKAALDIANKIKATAQGYDPCEIEWESDITCNLININLSIKNLYLDIIHTLSYKPSKNAISSIQCVPSYVQFEKPKIGQPNTQKITATALNSKFEITDITSSNPNFEINPTDFILKKGESIELTVTYTPIDSGYSFSKFYFINDICEQKYFASGGWNGIKPKVSSLKLIHPNGGEVFVVGSDTVITWEGISPAEEVQLDYSTDSGTSWNEITKEAKGLKYIWENVPKPASNNCLVRVTQGNIPDNYDPDDPTPQIIWQKTFGGGSDDGIRSIIECSDGTYVVAGLSKSSNGDITDNKGFTDVFLAKLDPNNGSIIWQKTLGGSLPDQASKIIESSDGNLVLVGMTYSYDKDVTKNNGNVDCWVVKFNQKDGNIIWEKTFGGNSYDTASSIIESSDGSYVVNGYVNSFDGDVTENKGISDCWIIKLDPDDGNIIWQKTYGGSEADWAGTVIESKDGNYVLSGNTYSKNGDITGNKGESDYWVIKINSDDGRIIWQKTYGGSDSEWASSIIESNDGSYVVAGYSNSKNGDVTENKGISDCWIIKLDPNDGNIIWERSFGGKEIEQSLSIIQSRDGNFIFSGYTASNNGDITNNNGKIDYWIFKVSPIDGHLIWQKTLGGSDYDYSYSIIQSSDGAYVVAGYTESKDGDITENKGSSDCWVVKLFEGNIVQSDVSDSLFSIVEPLILSHDIDMKQELVGSVKDSVIQDFIINTGSWKFSVDSIYFRGTDADAFSIVSGFPKYIIEANNSHFAEISFSPERIGIHNAEIVIITQSDTLFQNITGEGIEKLITVIDKIIDFGKVNLGNSKDTLQAVTIQNIGSVPIEVLNTKHNYPNDVDFTTISGGGNFILQPNETRLMDLRFTPSDEGRTTGTLEFHYNGVGSPAILQLYGEGINKSPQIEANFEGFDDLVCDYYSTNFVEVSNKGGQPLEISEINITGSDPNDFSINETLPITVQPDSTVNLDLGFTPQSTGIKSAILNIISNSGIEPEYHIELFGKKDSVALFPNDLVIDLGVLCPNEIKDTFITISNKGTVFSGGFITGNSNLQIPNNEFQIDMDKQVIVDLTFGGKSELGNFDEKLTITDSICGYQNEISIIGEVILPEINTNDISITSLNGETNSEFITIENLSDREIEITAISGLTAPFELVGNPLPFSIEANGSNTIEISYAADDEIEDVINITIEGKPCDISTYAEITGMPVISSASIQTTDLEAYPGEEIEVKVILNASNNIEIAGIESISATLTFNPTLLDPMDYNMEFIDEHTAKIRIDDIPLSGNAGDILKNVRFKVGLGNAEECDLILSDAEAKSGNAEIDLISGKFKLLGVCYEGGTRLLNPYSEVGIQSISPNPAEGEIEIEVSLKESGWTELSIYNTLGEKLETILSESIEDFGERTIKAKVSDYSSGLYFIVLKTPTVYQSKQVMIMK